MGRRHRICENHLLRYPRHAGGSHRRQGNHRHFAGRKTLAAPVEDYAADSHRFPVAAELIPSHLLFGFYAGCQPDHAFASPRGL